jgi:hypothetical protein
MKTVRLLIISLLAALLCACPSRKEEDTVAVRGRNARTGINATDPGSQSTGSLPNGTYEGQSWGEVYCPDASQQESFMQKVLDLVSSTLSPDLFGYVSCQHADSTGIRFKGYIEVDGNGNVALGRSSLRLVIWDSEAGKQTADGETIPEYPIDFDRVQSGSMQGNHAELVFADEYGEIRFSGNYDQNYYRGTLSFRNNKSVDGGAPRSGTFPGEFVVKTCGFFRCRN